MHTLSVGHGPPIFRLLRRPSLLERRATGCPCFAHQSPPTTGRQCDRYSNNGNLYGHIPCSDAFVAGFDPSGEPLFHLPHRLFIRLGKLGKRHCYGCTGEPIRSWQRLPHMASNEPVIRWRKCVRSQTPRPRDQKQANQNPPKPTPLTRSTVPATHHAISWSNRRGIYEIDPRGRAGRRRRVGR